MCRSYTFELASNYFVSQEQARRHAGAGLRWARFRCPENEGVGMGTLYSHDASLRVPLGLILSLSGKLMLGTYPEISGGAAYCCVEGRNACKYAL